MDYKEIELHGRKIRFYDENHIEMEFRNKKGDWRRKNIYTSTCGYNLMTITTNKAHHIAIHRLVFYLHNPLWNIYDSSNDNSIDHFDGNRFNNKIENLSCVTHQENQWNRTKAKGYCWHKEKQKWHTSIRINCNSIHLGYFENEEDARDAYIKAKLIYHVIQPKSFA